MTPDYERAATLATELLIKYDIRKTPIDPLPLLKDIPNVYVMTFEEVSQKTNVERSQIFSDLGYRNLDALTTVFMEDDHKRYLVTYNKLLSSKFLDRALARELGHILLGHDGSRPEAVRNEEARCFAHHLLVPRALIHTIQSLNIRLTVDLLGGITGCFDHCLNCIRMQPAVHVPAELNATLRDQLMPYIMNLFQFQHYASLRDGSALADLGNYMAGYEE